MKELQHRVKNNLNVISSFLILEIDNLKDPHPVSIFKKTINRIQSLSLIYDKLNLDKDFTKTDLSIYLENLIQAIFKTYTIQPDKITLKTHLESVYLESSRAIPLGLIINELITNSLKHAFPQNKKGFINVDLNQFNQQIYLKVSDDGIGIPNGSNRIKSESMGLNLINILSRQINGKLDFQYNKGVTTTITLPI